LPADKLARINAELESSGRKKLQSNEKIQSLCSNCYPEFGLESINRENLFKYVGELPPDFTIYLFESDLKDIELHWNHNFIAFTAVSLERDEVVYYTANW
jgi:hypothetical protein